MRRRNPHLIVPIHDRRQHVRIFTLKNFGWATLAFLVVFAAISIRSELSSSEPRPGDYGRIYGGAVPPVEQKPMEVVTEDTPSAVDDQSVADPMLVEPMAREQWLHGTAASYAGVHANVPVTVESPRGDVAIVGGPEGVSVVQRERARPQLSGGFGRR